MQGERMLGNDNVYGKMLEIVDVCGKNARNHQCVRKKYLETSMYVGKCSEAEIHAKETLRIGNVCGKMLRNVNAR